jgi:hypothetical protein
MTFESRTLITGRIEEEFDGFPRRVVLDDRDYVVVLPQGRRPPKVFSSSGRFVGQLGKSGRGPGEITRPTWLDRSLDDSIRVYESGRVVAFDAGLQAARTTTDGNPQWPRYLTPLVPGEHAMISARYATTEAIANPIIIRSDSGATYATIPVPRTDGQLTFTVFTRDLVGRRSLWLVEYENFALQGYRIVHLDDRQSRRVHVQRSPDWWQLRTQKWSAASQVRDVRQIDSRTLAILAATPRRDWRSIPYDTLTGEGVWQRLDTVVELIDIQTRAVIASGRLAGAPVSFASENTVATYREDADGYPILTISRFTRR